MPTRRLVLPCVVLTLTLTACNGGDPGAAPEPSAPSESATATASPTVTTTPTKKPTTKPTAKPSPTATPSPAKTGLPQAGGPAPTAFSPADFSFIGANFGWALGRDCGSAPCTAKVARTTNGGRTWHALPALKNVKSGEDDGDSVRAIRFGNQNDGWIFGPTLYATHNGGQSWKQIPTDGDVVALEQTRGTTWLVVSSCEAGGCKLSLWTAPSSSDSFTLRSVIPGTDANEKTYQLVRAGSAHGWVSGWGNGDSEILRTTDGGKTWQQVANPCKTQGNYRQRLSRYDTQHLWLVCASDAESDTQVSSVYHSSDAGSHWGSKNAGPKNAAPTDLQAFGARQLGVLATTEGLLRTNDGGITWRTVVPSTGDFGFGKVETIDFTNGWALGFGAIHYTRDRGLTWGKYVFKS
ncbi:MAG TPA: YCF48-related protein [Frankiaceae bacterium]|nr:YCF48-related protein [Frankiaceae bacterium]